MTINLPMMLTALCSLATAGVYARAWLLDRQTQTVALAMLFLACAALAGFQAISALPRPA